MSKVPEQIDPVSGGCVEALHLADDPGRLAAASSADLAAAASFLARGIARVGEGTQPSARRGDAIVRLELAGRAIGAEQARRVFAPQPGARVNAPAPADETRKSVFAAAHAAFYPADVPD